MPVTVLRLISAAKNIFNNRLKVKAATTKLQTFPDTIIITLSPSAVVTGVSVIIIIIIVVVVVIIIIIIIIVIIIIIINIVIVIIIVIVAFDTVIILSSLP